MGIFVCDFCGCVENTALAGARGWHARRLPLSPSELERRPDLAGTDLGDGKARCSECNPELGEWHGRWEKETYDPERHQAINR